MVTPTYKHPLKLKPQAKYKEIQTKFGSAHVKNLSNEKEVKKDTS